MEINTNNTNNITINAVNINPIDIVRLIQQFCLENNFSNTLRTLQEESRIKLNLVESIQNFKNNVKNRRWDLVLQTIDRLQINSETLLDLYEQVIYDLIENDDREVARVFLYNICKNASSELKSISELKFKQLENIVNDPKIKISEIYAKEKYNKDYRISKLTENLSHEVYEATPNHLEQLIAKGLEKICLDKNLSLNEIEKYDILNGKVKDINFNLPSIVFVNNYDENLNKSSSNYVREVHKKLNFGVNSRIEAAKFSPDGSYLATGSLDGFIEIWDPMTGSLKPELTYQLENVQMRHIDSVTSLNFTKDSKMLCSGDLLGNIKVFKVANGKCLREFPNAHSKAVTCLVFTKDNSQIISGSFDNIIRVFGLKAGILINELKGHTSFINDLQINWNDDKLYSASSDGTVKIWNVKHYELIKSISPPTTQAMIDVSINNVIINPRMSDTIFVSNRSNKIYLMASTGEVLEFFSTERSKSIIYMALSYDGLWLYCVDEENTLFTFSVEDNIIRNFIKVHEKDVIGLCHHPNSDLLVSFALDGYLNIYL